MKLKKEMFREYDIRGMVNENELNEKSVKFIGKGFGTMLKRRGIQDCVVGFDARSYSEMLKNALVKGITSTGVNVIEIGRTLSEIAYFAQHHLKIKGVAMVTASHNPNGWSGFKFGCDFSSTFLTKDIKELYNLVCKEDFEHGKGKVKKEDVFEHYKNDILKRVDITKKFKIVVNARNGTAGLFAPNVLRGCGCEVVEQFCDIDFNFPNGEPNPSLMGMLEELGKKVREESADLGFAFDGDGDRIGMVDEEGNVVFPDRILILLARLILKKRPGAKIVFDVKSTQALFEDIKAHGGEPVIWKTGHSFIKEKIHETGAALGGERSGHIFYMDGYYGFDDAIFVALKVLEYLSKENKRLSEIMKTTPQYFVSPVIHAPCADEIKYKVMDKIMKNFKKRFDNVIDINGARVVFKDGWGLVRPSSNLPVLVLVFEAKTKKRLKEIEELFRKELGKYHEISKEWRNG